MQGMGDPAVQAHLEHVRALYADAGAIQYIEDVVRRTWRANRRRWSPSRHFDDTNTLGYQTSRNVNNRISLTIETSDVAPSVLPETELGVVILGLAGFRLRVVKAPIESGLTPDFENGFDWSASATRETAARRNSSRYYPLASDELAFEFEDDPRPKERRQVESCRDVFLLWAAELSSNRTAGWLGLPKMGDTPWMGLLGLWLDAAIKKGDRAGSDGTANEATGIATGTAYVDEDEDEDPATPNVRWDDGRSEGTHTFEEDPDGEGE